VSTKQTIKCTATE